MSRKRYTPEQIIGKLREAEVLLSQGQRTGEVCRRLGISERKLRDELLNCEIFYTLKEAQVLIEQWRRHDNTLHAAQRAGLQTTGTGSVLADTKVANYAVPPPPHGGHHARLSHNGWTTQIRLITSCSTPRRASASGYEDAP